MNWIRLGDLVLSMLALFAPLPLLHSAAAADEPAPTVIELGSMPAQDERGNPLEGEYWITVMLTTADGRYISDRAVQIVEPVDFFGPREAQLGKAVTDGTGFAAVVYQPSRAGTHTIVARFGGDKQYAKSRAEVVFDASNVVAPFAEEPLPLTSVGRGLSLFLGALGLAFWGFMLVMLGRTVRRIRSAPAVAGPSTAVSAAQSQEAPI